MRILAVDMGTGTQDILLFDSAGPVENSVKMVMPSATRDRRGGCGGTRRERVLRAVHGRDPGWRAVRAGRWSAISRRGVAAYATPGAARTFDDDLDEVQRMGVRVVSDDEAAAHERRGADRNARSRPGGDPCGAGSLRSVPRIRRPGDGLSRPRRGAAGLLRPTVSLRPPAAGRGRGRTTCWPSRFLPRSSRST